MKSLLLITLFLYLSTILFAQLPDLILVEYYIDTDPGYGLATEVSVEPNSELDLNFNADISALTEGVHTLYVRGKDTADHWSTSVNHTFYVGFNIPNQPVSRVEYYFDNDPGYGNATALTLTEGNDVDMIVNLDVTELSDGIHVIFFRAQDVEGQWTTTKNHTFYKGIFATGIPADIKTVEYYIDSDPGFGNGNKVAFTAGSELDLTFNVDLTSFTEGCHDLFVRVQDENDSWSLINQHPFCITPTGITDIGVSNIHIYPNPSKGDFTIQLESNNKNTTIEIYNVVGQKVFINNYYSECILDNISLAEAKGLYMVKVKSGDEVTFRKLQIE